MEYRIRHETRYTYERPVGSSYQSLHLTPRQFTRQSVASASVSVTPEPLTLESRTDFFGNPVTDLFIRDPHEELVILAESSVVVLANEEVLLDLSPAWEQAAELAANASSIEAREAARYRFPSPQISLNGTADYIASLLTPGKPLLRLAMELTEKIYTEFDYEGGVTDVYTPVPQILESRAGVCQDFAHLGIACLRACGLAARYVSGYLLTQPPEGKPRLTGADASHAWFSTWCPEFGWVDFDPTNNIQAQTEHITLGWGRDYSDVSPTRGFIRGGGSQTLDVAVDVIPVGVMATI
ncbi:MAG: transglutaminase family protein [Gammaproteobacteria bacterium]|jgi:transglutaminase-like putative cysteine protease